MRHVRTQHPKNEIKCNRCNYITPHVKKYRMVEHQKIRHGLDEDHMDITEVIIPVTPPKEAARPPPRSYPLSPNVVNCFGPPARSRSATVSAAVEKKREKRPRSESAHEEMPSKPQGKTLRTLQQTPKKGPSDTITSDPITPLLSPVTITLGFDDHPKENISPVCRRLAEVFSRPPRPLSPLPPTPEKRVTEQKQKTPKRKVVASRTVVKSNKKDSSHLALPQPDDIQKRHKRFLGAPSTFANSRIAELMKEIRKEAVSSETYTGSVLPYGYNAVKKDEKVILPDGTIYILSSTWVPDPRISSLETSETQTPSSSQVPQTADKWTNVGETYLAAPDKADAETEIEDCFLDLEQEDFDNRVLDEETGLFVFRKRQDTTVEETDQPLEETLIISDEESDSDSEVAIRIKVEPTDSDYDDFEI